MSAWQLLSSALTTPALRVQAALILAVVVALVFLNVVAVLPPLARASWHWMQQELGPRREVRRQVRAEVREFRRRHLETAAKSGDSRARKEAHP
jgi:hypothetical protein